MWIVKLCVVCHFSKQNVRFEAYSNELRLLMFYLLTKYMRKHSESIVVVQNIGFLVFA